MSRGYQRFPSIDWYCDRCGAYLNDQDEFDDNYDEWVCEECGYHNEISEAMIQGVYIAGSNNDDDEDDRDPDDTGERYNIWDNE